jgi:FkbM family methyltransferase
MNFLKYVYPLSLRYKLAHKMLFLKVSPFNISLLFANKVRIDLNSNDISHKLISLTGFYELELTKLISKQAKLGGILIDVGANYGYYSLLWMSLNHSNIVLSYEASEVNYKSLIKNFEKNNLFENTYVFNIALSKYKEELYFDNKFASGQTGWGGLSFTGNNNKVVCSFLDLELAKFNFQIIDVLKIDVEGADYWVLLGCKNYLLNRIIKNIYFEVNVQRMKELRIKESDIFNYLDSVNYNYSKISKDTFHAYPNNF